MAIIQTDERESVYQIKKWRGVNEATEGESSLKIGEAAVMRNFRVTPGGALKKRGGSKNVAGLMSGYVVSVDTSKTEILTTENGASTASFTMYPTCTADTVGKLTLSGTAATVTFTNAASYVGYFYKDIAGAVHKFVGVSASGV